MPDGTGVRPPPESVEGQQWRDAEKPAEEEAVEDAPVTKKK